MTSCEYVENFFRGENLNWAAQNLRLGCGLDIAAQDEGLDRRRWLLSTPSSQSLHYFNLS